MRVPIPSILVLVIPALAAGLAAAGGVDDPVTRMGKTLLRRSDLVVRGEVSRSSRLGAGVSIVRFTVSGTLFGPATTGTLTLLTDDPGVCPEPKIPCVLFLARLSGDRYRPVERMDLVGDEGAARERTLRAYLAIEIEKDSAAKRRALRELLLANLASGETFLVYSAARELAHFTEENAPLFTPQDAAALVATRDAARDPLLVDLLETTLERLPPPPPAERDAPAGPRVPRPPEFEMLAAAWAAGIPDTAERRAVVASLCARHLKHAGPILLLALSDTDPGVREVAAREVGEAGLGEAVAPLVALLGREKEREVLRAAFHGLGLLRAAEALPAMVAFAADPALVRGVATAAARIGTAEALDWIRAQRAARTDREPELADFLGFLLSERFAEQEAALAKIRAARLR